MVVFEKLCCVLCMVYVGDVFDVGLSEVWFDVVSVCIDDFWYF